LVGEDFDPLSSRRWHEERHRQHAISGGEHAGADVLSAGDAAAMPTIAFVKKFRKEFEDHLEGRPCPYEKAGAVEELPVMAH